MRQKRQPDSKAVTALLTALVCVFGIDRPFGDAMAQEQAAPPSTTQATQPVAEPPSRTNAHGTLNEFMDLYRKGDADSKKRLIAYLDLSGLAEEDRANAATLAVRLATFLDTEKLATNAAYEQLKADPDAEEHCLLWEEPAKKDSAQSAAAATTDKGKCLVRLVKQSDGRWLFDAATTASINILAARKEPKPVESATPTAAPSKTGEPSHKETAPAPKAAPAYASPQATMRTFLEAFAKHDVVLSATCLNLQSYGVQPNDRMAILLAKALKFVLDRTVYVQFLDIPEDSDHQSPYVYRIIQERWNIELERVANGSWLFSTATLDHLQEMCRAVADSQPKVPNAPVLSIREMPQLWLFLKLPSQVQRPVWGLEIWQWLGLILVTLIGVICNRVARVILRRISRWILHRIRGRADVTLEESVLRPVGFVILGYVWLEFFQWLWLPKILASILTNTSWFIVVTAGVWATYRVIDLISGYLSILADRSASKFDVMLVPFGRKLLKIVITIVGLVYFIQRIFPENIGTVLGGLGLGGLAFALAAQDALKNLFGSVTVMLDRPFEIGDWVKIGEVEGTVESVGFRSTRIRTFYHSQINLPNGKLIDAIVDNLGRRRYRRIRCMLSLTYGTSPEKIEAFCEGVRELIRRHPYTRKDYYHVYLNQMAAHSLDVLLYCFIESPDWSTELRERHRLFADILRLADRLGVDFAFPTQTLHMHNADAAPPPPSRPAEEDELSPEIVGRSEAAAITEATLPPPESLGPVKIAVQPQPVDEKYVAERLGRRGGGPDKRR